MILVKRGWLIVQCLLSTLELVLQCPIVRWKQSMQSEDISFLFRKGGALIETRIVQQIVTRKPGSDHVTLCVVLEFRLLHHCGPLLRLYSHRRANHRAQPAASSRPAIVLARRPGGGPRKATRRSRSQWR